MPVLGLISLLLVVEGPIPGPGGEGANDGVVLVKFKLASVLCIDPCADAFVGLVGEVFVLELDCFAV